VECLTAGALAGLVVDDLLAALGLKPEVLGVGGHVESPRKVKSEQ
jgi:hypothetical protein